MNIYLGQKLEIDFSYDETQVKKFIEITGDNNPIHYDKEYASKTSFKKPIIHGFLSASIFSKIFGTILPGEGTIYLSQTLKFMKPMYVDVNYRAIVEIIELFFEKNRCKVSTKVIDPSGEEIILGDAILYNKNIINK